MPDDVYRAKELREFWRKRNCPGPDARPMHLYLCDDDEYAALGHWLKPRLQSRAVSSGVAGWFALWAVERIRRFYAGGGLTWAFVFAGMSVEPDQRQAAELAEKGLLFWRRPLRRSAMGGGRHFLYSLMAEGGLPDALLARESGYRAALLGTIADIGAMGAATALTIARRWLGALPQVYQEDQAASSWPS